MERFVHRPRLMSRIRTGPLGLYVDSFVEELIEQGYSRDVIGAKLRLIAGFGTWLNSKRLTAEDVTEAQIEKYLRQRTQSPRHVDRPTLKRLLQILQEKNIASAPLDFVAPRTVLTHEYSCYLQQERALAPRSVAIYKSWATRFLEAQFGDEKIVLTSLQSVSITEFVRSQTKRIGQKACKLMTTALRSFLQFLRYRGYIGSDLSAAVPAVASWTMATIPKALPLEQVEQVLKSCPRDTATGRRDYAIILLMARLGLRANEVAQLRLDDVDWQIGCITVRGKGGQLAQLPLPLDVGDAIVDYIKNGRPRSAFRKIFLSAQAPIHGFSCNRRISMLVGEALERAGIDSERKGAHQLRHALASGMLQRGATLREIGEILRHRDVQSTAIYAKVDLVSLQEVAMPWPGGVQ